MSVGLGYWVGSLPPQVPLTGEKSLCITHTHTHTLLFSARAIHPSTKNSKYVQESLAVCDYISCIEVWSFAGSGMSPETLIHFQKYTIILNFDIQY